MIEKQEDGDALIHLRVPAATKARWVRESRAEGMRLTGWITRAVEQAMLRAIRIVIPDDLTFSDLHLARDPATGDVSFDWATIERICAASGLDVATFRDAPESHVAGLLVQWYQQHLAHGGAPDPIADDLTDETVAEDAAGQHASHKPGRA